MTRIGLTLQVCRVGSNSPALHNIDIQCRHSNVSVMAIFVPWAVETYGKLSIAKESSRGVMLELEVENGGENSPEKDHKL